MAEHPNRVRQLFDSLAVAWPEGHAQGGRFACRLARFATALESCVAPGSRVLDLGCETEEMARTLATLGSRVTGCDISEQIIRLASSTECADAVEWIRLDMDWRALPFSSCSFDAVVASSVLEYVEEPTIVLRERICVLCTTGVMLCTVPDLRRPIRLLEQLATIVARLPTACSASHRWTSLERYMTYLTVSKQRHPIPWWLSVPEGAGLSPISHLPDTESGSPLCLLGFRGSDNEANP